MVITNRLGITDSPTLAREEERISKKAATTLFEENLLNDMPSGTWTTLQKIHTILFQDIYDFAGALRSVNIVKGNFRFVPVMYLAEAVRTIENMPQSTFEEIVEKYVEMICTHFPGHILFTSLNTWMLPCISQGASILFLLESFCYCNS